MSNPKTRHYTHLASRLRNLTTALAETEHQMDLMAHHLASMQSIGINTGAQFMAVSRLLDKELVEENDRQAALNEAGGAREDEAR